MKIRLFNLGILASVLLMTLSGCSSDETFTNENDTAVKSMKINISDGLFTSVDDSGANTRATDTETATSFGSGDAIGIFAVKSDGTLALTNAKYTYDGTSWVNSDNTDLLPYYDGAKYFAYYPYQANLTSDKYNATQTTAEAFFAPLISGWTPAADQSTQTNYSAQDLMVSMATVDASTNSSSFTMSHQMSIVEMDFHQVHYTYYGTGTYRFTFDTTNKPFNVADGKYRLLVNPNNILSVTGKNQYNSTDATKTKGWKISGTTPAASKYKIYKYNGASACLTEIQRQNVCLGDANIGDYLYADGTSGTTFKSGSTVGIIFSSELTQTQYDAGCRHGRAIALKDAYSSTCAWSSNSAPNNSLYPDQTVHPYCQDFKTCFNDVSSGYDASSSSYASSASNLAWEYCKNYSDGTTKSFTNSGWYLPSAGEWWDIMENLCTWTADNMNNTIKPKRSASGMGYIISDLPSSYYSTFDTKLTAGGAGSPLQHGYYYWAASEYSSSSAVLVAFFSDYLYLASNNKTYSSNSCVRAVLAY